MAAVRRGLSLRPVGPDFGVSPATVWHWVHHAAGQLRDRVDWSDRPHTPIKTRRTADTIEDQVLQLRRELRHDSDLGFYGAQTIHDVLADRQVRPLPSVRTIGRILQRRGIQPSWRCLELGAGAGSIARWLAARCPNGKVVATDIGTSFLTGLSAPNLQVLRQGQFVRQYVPWDRARDRGYRRAL